MFTIEFDDDETVITVLDQSGNLEDVAIFLYDDCCHIRQWNEKLGRYDVITLTAEMYLGVMKAWKMPEGTYILKK